MERRKILLITAAVIAALGTILVVVYVRGADSRAASNYSAVKVLTAVKDIEVGESVSAAQAAGKIQLADVAKGAVVAGALTDLSSVTKDVAIAHIYPGEQLISGKFGTSSASTTLTIPPGKIALSVNLSDPQRVAGFVQPGNNVALFAQQSCGCYSRLLLSSVPVLGVGTTSITTTTTTNAAGGQTTEQLPRTLLTLAVTSVEAEKILFAMKNGDISAALLPATTTLNPEPGVTAANLFQ